MSKTNPIASTPPHVCLPALLVAATLLLAGGCQDGPLYALKAVNPYFTMKEWKEDSDLGVTDHERRVALTKLADSIATLPPQRQKFWSGQLENILVNDESPEMRRLAVLAAGRLADSAGLPLIQKGLDDSIAKVRMEACRALGGDSSEQASRMLAATLGRDTNLDVRHSAIAALAGHTSPIAIDSLRTALKDRNPATADLAIDSLRDVTGKNLGDDPQVWIAALENETGNLSDGDGETRIADRIRGWF